VTRPELNHGRSFSACTPEGLHRYQGYWLYLCRNLGNNSLEGHVPQTWHASSQMGTLYQL